MSDSIPTPVLLREAPPVAAPAPPSPPTPAQLRRNVRIASAAILVVCTLMLGIGGYLHPQASGLGTHQELGLPPCGFYDYYHIPCPTCGCTTAVAYVAHGHPIKALLTQPFGAAVGFLGILLAPLSLLGLITGRWHGPQPFTLQWYWKELLWLTLALLAVGWAYKYATMP